MDLWHQRCPEFQVLDIDQRMIRPKDFHGRWLWLLFHRHFA